MVHPQQFDDDDPTLVRLRRISLALPGAAEKVSHGRPMFYTKKIFAGFGAVTKGDHHSGRYDQSLVFMPTEDEVAALEQHPFVFTPAYWGPYGWLGYDLSKSPEWDEVAELIEESFRNTAGKRLIAELDARQQ